MLPIGPIRLCVHGRRYSDSAHSRALCGTLTLLIRVQKWENARPFP
jgi:hypothetical protein